jgi:DNA-binding MarR family transcriptional regulator
VTDARDEAAEIVRALRRIIRRVTLHSKRLSKETGLTVPQTVCLRALAEAEADGLLVADLSHRVQLSPATVSGILDRLERDGAIERQRMSSDRRKVRVSLTDEGRNKLSSMPASLQEVFSKKLASLSDDERAVVLESLHRIVELMDAGEIDASPILVSDAVVRKQ